jgi:hypothetical protein
LEEAQLVGITHSQWEAMVAIELDTPPRNQSINDISEGDAYRLTRFRKDQLQLLIVHYRIPEHIVVGANGYVFNGEEMLIVSLSKIATRLSWMHLCKDIFSGNPRRWSPAFKWFINHSMLIFITRFLGVQLSCG